MNEIYGQFLSTYRHLYAVRYVPQCEDDKIESASSRFYDCKGRVLAAIDETIASRSARRITVYKLRDAAPTGSVRRLCAVVEFKNAI